MKTLILDESKWRCGGESDRPENRRGGLNTSTALLNGSGRMCCLGQFSLQIDKTLKKKDIRGLGEPGEISREIEGLNVVSEDYSNIYYNTPLSSRAMRINDDEETTVREKVKKLRKLFKSNGFRTIFRKQKKKV